MKTLFCPNCGAQCRAEDSQCPDCRFPMRLNTITYPDHVRIPKSHLKHWQQISQLLMRNSIKVENRGAVGWSQSQVWLILPGFGLLLFLTTLLFGGNVVDLIWKPPEAPVAMLDLNLQENGGNPLPNAGSESVDPPGGTDSPANTSFLQEALQVTRAQKNLDQELGTDLQEYVDKPEVSAQEIRRLSQRALVLVEVRDRHQKGVIVNESGLLLVDADIVRDAFRTETQTLASEGRLVQEARLVLPTVGRPGEPMERAQLSEQSDRVGVSLLRVPNSFELPYELNFEESFREGEFLWITTFHGGDYYPQKVRITGVTRQGSIADGTDLTFWSLDTDYQNHHSGSPVFNIHGQLSGLLICRNNRNMVLSLDQLRARAPLIYKGIL